MTIAAENQAEKVYRNYTRVLYLRNYALHHRPYIGCLATNVSRETNEISYAISICSPEDKFDERIAKEIASGRIKKTPVTLKLDEVPKTWHEITKLIMEHIVESNKTVPSELPPKKGESRSVFALRAATGWLDYTAKLHAKQAA